jgi:DNA-binding MarR family transcriptional regulator
MMDIEISVTILHCKLSNANTDGIYVNMTDINTKQILSDPEAVALVELLFFAYRDFVSDPDEILEELSFGRAHHRILHFVGRDPGMTVAKLLDILKITKQSLARVLKELINKGYVFQNEGAVDRRQRLLHLTEKGEALRNKLIAPQIERFQRAAAETSGLGFREMLLHLISPENRDIASDWILKLRKDR